MSSVGSPAGPRPQPISVPVFLLTEPDVGSDPARMAATAVPDQGGENYILNGSKLWTTNGMLADLVVVMARVGDVLGSM